MTHYVMCTEYKLRLMRNNERKNISFKTDTGE